MKKPTVFVGSFDLRGLMDILGSPPSSGFTSIAKSNSLSLTKHSLEKVALDWRIFDQEKCILQEKQEDVSDIDI